MIKLYKKGERVKLVKGLTSLEFECRCDLTACRATIVTNDIVKAYGKFRHLMNVPLKINSGFRCTQHNANVGGTARSRHLVGQAIDISLKSINHLSIDDIEHAARLSGFTFIKFYKTFVHLDVRETQK